MLINIKMASSEQISNYKIKTIIHFLRPNLNKYQRINRTIQRPNKPKLNSDLLINTIQHLRIMHDQLKQQ